MKGRNEDEIVEVYGDDNCKRNVHKMKKTEIGSCDDVKFIIVCPPHRMVMNIPTIE